MNYHMLCWLNIITCTAYVKTNTQLSDKIINTMYFGKVIVNTCSMWKDNSKILRNKKIIFNWKKICFYIFSYVLHLRLYIPGISRVHPIWEIRKKNNFQWHITLFVFLYFLIIFSHITSVYEYIDKLLCFCDSDFFLNLFIFPYVVS